VGWRGWRAPRSRRQPFSRSPRPCGSGRPGVWETALRGRLRPLGARLGRRAAGRWPPMAGTRPAPPGRLRPCRFRVRGSWSPPRSAGVRSSDRLRSWRAGLCSPTHGGHGQAEGKPRPLTPIGPSSVPASPVLRSVRMQPRMRCRHRREAVHRVGPPPDRLPPARRLRARRRAGDHQREGRRTESSARYRSRSGDRSGARQDDGSSQIRWSTGARGSGRRCALRRAARSSPARGCPPTSPPSRARCRARSCRRPAQPR
jgi:hypothetical protein